MPEVKPEHIQPRDIIGYKTQRNTSVVHDIHAFGQKSMGYVAEIITDESTGKIQGVLVCEIVRPDTSVKNKLQDLQSDELRFFALDASKFGLREDGTRIIIPKTRFIPIKDILIASKTEAFRRGRVENDQTAQAIETAMLTADSLSTDRDDRHMMGMRQSIAVWDGGNYANIKKTGECTWNWDNVPLDIWDAIQRKIEEHTYGGKPRTSQTGRWFGKIGAANAGSMSDLPLIFAEKAGMPKYLVQAFTAPARGTNLKPLLTLRQVKALSDEKLGAYLKNVKTGTPEDLTVEEAFKQSENLMAQTIAQWIQDESKGSRTSTSFQEILEAKQKRTLGEFIGNSFFTGQAEDIIKEILPKLKRLCSESTPDINGAKTIQETWDKMMQAQLSETHMPDFTNNGPEQEITLVNDRRVKSVPDEDRVKVIQRGDSTIITLSKPAVDYLTRDLN